MLIQFFFQALFINIQASAGAQRFIQWIIISISSPKLSGFKAGCILKELTSNPVTEEKQAQ